MSLEAQIQLMTVPQEFTRLCNAVLSAEHGDDFLPIDDDRPDRGNDGYLKSEQRVYAVHCFKRVQNQGLDTEVRRKMLGDLGKAITLKQEGLWEIAAWTFLSNYPIDEAVGRAALKLAAGSGIDVSWKGPDFLALVLQRHSAIRALFPGLQVNEVAAEIKDLRESVVGGSGDLEPPERVPRTREEHQALLALRPDGWEYLLFGSVLVQRQAELEMKWHDHELPPHVDRRLIPDVGGASDFLSNEFRRLTSMIEAMMLVFSDQAKSQAFGLPGEPGDASRIEHMATRIVQTYAEMLDWAAGIRAVDPPAVLASVYEIAPKMATKPLQQFRQFFEDVVREIDRVPAFLANDPSEDAPLQITLSLVMAMDEEVSAEFHRRMKKARRKVRWGF